MAFIREYSQAAGDPFSLRIPKRLRKLKVGRAIGGLARKVLPIASAFIPGLGGVAGAALSRILAKIPAPVRETLTAAGYEPAEQAVSFARAYGLEMGDPAPRPAKKRKAAGSGPKAKAAAKAEKRSERAARPARPGKKGAKAPGGAKAKEPIDWGAILGGAANVAGSITGGAGAKARAALGSTPLGSIVGEGLFAGRGGIGGRRRSMNPANVKALRRGIRRLEGFEKLVKRIEKAYPRIRRHAPGGRARAGHRAGCRCVACKRAA